MEIKLYQLIMVDTDEQGTYTALAFANSEEEAMDQLKTGIIDDYYDNEDFDYDKISPSEDLDTIMEFMECSFYEIKELYLNVNINQQN